MTTFDRYQARGYTGLFRAVYFLEDRLGDGKPHSAADIKREARSLGIQRPTLIRAASFARVVERRHAAKGGRHTWHLPYIVGEANARNAGIDIHPKEHP